MRMRFCRCAGVAVGGVEQQDRVAEGDRARILHRAGPVLRHGDEVDLLERMLAAEVLLQRREHRRRDLGGELRQVALPFRRDDAAGDAHAFDRRVLELARRPWR